VLAVELYRRHPERIRSLVLSDTFAGGASQPAAEREAGLQARLQALATMTPAEMAAARAPRLLAPGYTPAVLEEVASVFAEIHPAGYRTAAIALNAADERDVLPRIAVPVLVLAGDHDQIVPMSAAEYLRDHIPGARLVVIANAGHMGSQEQPQAYNAALRGFLASEE
jgi:pimeloyl-ACP methyl ester carboxylesterase